MDLVDSFLTQAKSQTGQGSQDEGYRCVKQQGFAVSDTNQTTVSLCFCRPVMEIHSELLIQPHSAGNRLILGSSRTVTTSSTMSKIFTVLVFVLPGEPWTLVVDLP